MPFPTVTAVVLRSCARVCALAVVVAGVIGAPTAAQAAPASPSTFVAHFGPDVPADVRAAVDFAMAIWAQRLESAVPIEVDVDWAAGLPANVASSTEPLGYEPVANGSLQPVALANALSGRDLAPGVSDIHLLLGDGVRWYTGLDGAAPANATDMVTMVLHELGHGLGFAHSFRETGGGLTWGRDGLPVGLDTGLFDAALGRLIDEPSPSFDLLSAATSRRVVWQGSARDSHGHAPVMYAPSRYEPSSSLSHFDDDAYPPGDPDALMTSLIRRGEVIHEVGPAALGVLHDLGWQVVDEQAPAPEEQVRTNAAPLRTAGVANAAARPTTAPVSGVPTRGAIMAPALKHVVALGDMGRTDARAWGVTVLAGAFLAGVGIRRRAVR